MLDKIKGKKGADPAPKQRIKFNINQNNESTITEKIDVPVSMELL